MERFGHVARPGLSGSGLVAFVKHELGFTLGATRTSGRGRDEAGAAPLALVLSANRRQLRPQNTRVSSRQHWCWIEEV